MKNIHLLARMIRLIAAPDAITAAEEINAATVEIGGKILTWPQAHLGVPQITPMDVAKATLLNCAACAAEAHPPEGDN